MQLLSTYTMAHSGPGPLSDIPGLALRGHRLDAKQDMEASTEPTIKGVTGLSTPAQTWPEASGHRCWLYLGRAPRSCGASVGLSMQSWGQQGSLGYVVSHSPLDPH
jgi:hypothetical protein